MINSRTTQNSIVGASIAGTIVLWLFSFLRAKWPDVMWAEAHDNEIVVYLTAVIGPLLARQIAFFRTPEKKNG